MGHPNHASHHQRKYAPWWIDAFGAENATSRYYLQIVREMIFTQLVNHVNEIIMPGTPRLGTRQHRRIVVKERLHRKVTFATVAFSGWPNSNLRFVILDTASFVSASVALMNLGWDTQCVSFATSFNCAVSWKATPGREAQKNKCVMPKID